MLFRFWSGSGYQQTTKVTASMHGHIWGLCEHIVFWGNKVVGITSIRTGVRNRNLTFLFFNQNICCGYSKEPSQWDGSFEHSKLMLKNMGKIIFTILCWNFFLSKPVKYWWNWHSDRIIVLPFDRLSEITSLRTSCCQLIVTLLKIDPHSEYLGDH